MKLLHFSKKAPKPCFLQGFLKSETFSFFGENWLGEGGAKKVKSGWAKKVKIGRFSVDFPGFSYFPLIFIDFPRFSEKVIDLFSIFLASLDFLGFSGFFH